MVMDDKEKIELEKRNEDHGNYHSPSMSSDRRFSAANLSNSSMGIIPSDNLMAICKGGLVGSSAPMVNSYSPTVWDHSTNSQNLGYWDMSNTSHSSMVGNRKGAAASLTSIVDMGWNQPNSMSPQSLSQFPADSGFSERAARFSSFNMVNPLQVPEFMALYSSVRGAMQEVYTGNGLKSVQKNDPNLGETSKSVSVSLEQGATEANSSKNDVARRVVDGSGNESDEAEFSGGGDDQDEPSLSEAADKEPCAKEISLKKRKRGAQDAELDQTKDKTETQRKADPCPTSAGNRTTRKQTKRGSQASDSPKDEYIHVRARRGQATNSHSLAERVRREKISERMKYLQDLVPSCSKVTGKAVMLDEIINYVQSLQRQVEFLSMKLATVNPGLDSIIENLLPKDILYSRTEHSSVGFTPNLTMAYSPLHSSHPVLNQASVVGMGSYRRNISPQMASMSTGSREPSQPQQPNMWEDELHNVVHMNLAASSSQDINVSANKENES